MTLAGKVCKLLLYFKTRGELVKDQPALSKVFQQHKIDFCCGGKIPLAEACAKKGIDPEVILTAIAEMVAEPALVDADAMSLTELVEHIEITHHAYLREELPRLDFMTKKVAAVHGEHGPHLVAIRNVYLAFQEEILSHMMKEEQILFPMIKELENPDSALDFHCGSIQNPINQMEHEHDNAGDALAQFEKLTNGYTPPADACNTYRATYQALRDLEKDMHLHVHKENNVLFPKAIALENSRKELASV